MEKYIGLIIAITIFVLNMFDAVATHYFISNGLAIEANPIISYLIFVGGFKLMYLFKFVIGLLVLIVFSIGWKSCGKLGKGCILFLLIIYILIVSYQIFLFLI